MFITEYGTFDGKSWEELCQLCFKMKYGDEGYQEMKASPGDFGIEGYTLDTGKAFQCYSPEKQYTQSELTEKIRDKITRDLKKLRTYKDEIEKRLGGTKIRKWYFVTPVCENNSLLTHASSKANEVKTWGLNIISDDFSVEVRDAGFYSVEIASINKIHSEKLLIGGDREFSSIDWTDLKDEYYDNINRKNSKRVKESESGYDVLQKLNGITIRRLSTGEELLKSIAQNYPTIHSQLINIITQFEDEVEEKSLTWDGDANDLIESLSKELKTRINSDIELLNSADTSDLVNHVISRWLALCPLDIT